MCLLSLLTAKAEYSNKRASTINTINIYINWFLWKNNSCNLEAQISRPGTSHPYPDDTFYSVGRVPRKLLLKYLGIKMYLVRLKNPPAPKVDWGVANIAGLALASAGITSPMQQRHPPNNRTQ